MISGIGFVQPMFFVGVVENRDDPRLEGRVQVRAFGVHGSNRDIPTEDLPWATLIIGSHDVNFTPPPLNSWVFGFFIDGRDAQQPMILGLIPTQATDLVDPETYGWGSVPLEDYDRHSQGSRPRDIGLSPMSKLATGEFTNETYVEALETNRVKNISIAGGGIKGHISTGNGNLSSIDNSESFAISQVATTSQNEQEIYVGLRQRGLSDNAAKGIIANMIVESRLDPGINEISPTVQGSRGGYGLLQWTGDRRNSLEAEATRRNVPVNDLNFQLDYLMLELQTTERSSYNALKGASDPVDAARIFSEKNLRPGIPNMPKRLGEAKRLSNVQFSSQSHDYAQSIQRSSEAQKTQAAKIRQQIQEIQKRIDDLGASETLNDEAQAELDELKAQKLALEESLKRLEPSGSTTTSSGETYDGYYSGISHDYTTTTWEEPPAAYATQYPYNRVIETAAGHSIELDDTPGAERISIWHVNGSYIQISPTSTVNKSMQDSYDIQEKNHHVYIGGNNLVTIEGDCHVLVKGNKVEEIQGDYKQIVHGNVMIGGGGKIEINGSDRTDIRSASLGLDSNVENLSIRTGKNIVFQSGESINLKSKNIRLGASENMSLSGEKGVFMQSTNGDAHIKSNGNVFINPNQNVFMRAEGGSISLQAEGSFRVNSKSFAAIKSTGYMSLISNANVLVNSGQSININANTVLGVKSSGMYLNSEGTFDVLSSENMRISGANIDMTGDIVKISDFVQLAPSTAAEVAKSKEPINAAEYDFGNGEFGGDISDQAANAEQPTEAPSIATDGMSSPPSKSIQAPSKPILETNATIGPQ